eukprot:CAMPEP_0169402384 /NCGR_PEP_ID=MMETSP1017-20121227/55110_1 /TAXON_ID=342587 /ORGANISM="Karlodinium micrum, Strain CCMP2283" /LENGTH=72 /DNA_ID=CAMNT_0009508361 /DNA_START=400 /DNA_END=615 /DNA_ORIENTATION=-
MAKSLALLENSNPFSTNAAAPHQDWAQCDHDTNCLRNCAMHGGGSLRPNLLAMTGFATCARHAPPHFLDPTL